MSELDWNEYDFIECLGVLPRTDDYETRYIFSVLKHGLRLELVVRPFSSDIEIAIFQVEIDFPIIEFKITECSGTKFVNDKRGRYLEFAPAQVFGDRYERDFEIPVGVKLSVEPTVHIELFTKPT